MLLAIYVTHTQTITQTHVRYTSDKSECLCFEFVESCLLPVVNVDGFLGSFCACSVVGCGVRCFRAIGSSHHMSHSIITTFPVMVWVIDR